MIEGKGLTMRFGNNTALDGVDVCFGDNKIYGLLGRNGAGKSTLLSVVTNRGTNGQTWWDTRSRQPPLPPRQGRCR